METRALRYFLTVAEFGSYSRGAEYLRISQPAVSRQIAKLEHEIGARLFNRHGHGVSLTMAGRVLLERGQAALRQLDQVKAEITSAAGGPSGTISLALPPAAGQSLAPLLIERFSAECPNVFLKIAGGFSGYIHEWLVRGQVDLACVHDPLPQPGFKIIPLVNEQVFLVGRKGALRHRRAYIRTADLAALPLILPSRPNASRRLLDRWIAKQAVALNVRLEVDDHSIIRALIRSGAGFSLLTRSAIEADLRRGELQALPFRPRAYWPLALILPSDAPPSEIRDRLVHTIRAVAHDLVASGAWPGR